MYDLHLWVCSVCVGLTTAVQLIFVWSAFLTHSFPAVLLLLLCICMYVCIGFVVNAVTTTLRHLPPQKKAQQQQLRKVTEVTTVRCCCCSCCACVKKIFLKLASQRGDKSFYSIIKYFVFICRVVTATATKTTTTRTTQRKTAD